MQLLDDCVKTVQAVPKLCKHTWIIDSLGHTGMSSDELSVERGVKVYCIKKKFWRAAELGPFLHAINHVMEQTKNVTTTRGSQKYNQLPSGEVSLEGGIVQCLLINFYNREWLTNLWGQMKPAFDSLEINPNTYTLVHDQVIQE